MNLNIPQECYELIGIYLITNVNNNRCYIGQTSEGFYKRFLRHNNLLENNKHFNSYLQKSYNKHGTDAFTFSILKICDDASDLEFFEQFYISKYLEEHKCYNILSGGETMSGENNPFYGKHHAEESKKKMSEKKIGKYAGNKNYFWGENHSGENNGFYGKHHTDESRRIMSEKKKELYKNPENNPFYGKHHSEETKQKLRCQWQKGAKKVMCIETGVVYDSIKIAAQETGTCAKSISAVCCGTRHVANNLHWKHVTGRAGHSL